MNGVAWGPVGLLKRASTSTLLVFFWQFMTESSLSLSFNVFGHYPSILGGRSGASSTRAPLICLLHAKVSALWWPVARGSEWTGGFVNESFKRNTYSDLLATNDRDELVWSLQTLFSSNTATYEKLRNSCRYALQSCMSDGIAVWGGWSWSYRIVAVVDYAISMLPGRTAWLGWFLIWVKREQFLCLNFMPAFCSSVETGWRW